MPIANFEELLVTAWVSTLKARSGVMALAVDVVRWRPLAEYVGSMDSSGMGLVTVQCTRVTPAPRFGNTLSAAPGYVELTAWTMIQHDPYGSNANNLLGELRDAVSSSTIHNALNLTPRLVVYANGVLVETDAVAQDIETYRQRTITVACHATATA